MAREVRDPKGVTWRIRRRVFNASVTPRWRGVDDDPPLWAHLVVPRSFGSGDTALGTVLLLCSLVLLPLLLAFYFLPVLFLAIEVVLFIVLAGAGLTGRVLLRKPWRVEAASSEGDRCFWLVPRYGDGALLEDAVAAAVRNGGTPPAVSGATGPTAMTRRLPRRRQRR
jgi:hypothetical protein